MAPLFWTIGCLYGASAVTFGAFGAHGLKKRIVDPGRITNWSTAAHYQVCASNETPSGLELICGLDANVHSLMRVRFQLLHSGVLLLANIAAPQNKLAATLFTAGMTMFSGSIYLLVLDPQRFKFMGPVTPLGGLCLIGGWVALAFGKRLPVSRWT